LDKNREKGRIVALSRIQIWGYPVPAVKPCTFPVFPLKVTAEEFIVEWRRSFNPLSVESELEKLKLVMMIAVRGIT